MGETLFIALCGGIIGYLLGIAGKDPKLEVIQLPAPEPQVARQYPVTFRGSYSGPPHERVPSLSPDQQDAISALINFGYRKADIMGAVRKADSQNASEIIREVQKKLAKPQLFA